jgi:Meiotically up-regulated gene 113
VQLTGFTKGDTEDFEAVIAIKLSNVDFSLMYERINQGNTTVHQCTRMPLTAKQIIEVFLSFLHQDNNWKFKLPWSPPFGSEPIIGSSGAPIPHSEDRGVVYLLHAGAHYKIGKTIDPQSRYEALDIQLPWKVERVHEIATNNIHRLERHWHRHFADRRGNGEWFDLTSDDVEAFCSFTYVDYK